MSRRKANSEKKKKHSQKKQLQLTKLSGNTFWIAHTQLTKSSPDSHHTVPLSHLTVLSALFLNTFQTFCNGLGNTIYTSIKLFTRERLFLQLFFSNYLIISCLLNFSCPGYPQRLYFSLFKTNLQNR